MPTFATPDPITVTVELGAGDIRIVAGERTDTVVGVRPSDPANASDQAAAERTRVEYANGHLEVRGPKGWQHNLRRRTDSVDVRIEVPAGSQVRGSAGVAALHCEGPLGACHYKTGLGDIQVDEAGPVELRSGAGDIGVGRAVGHAEVATAAGAVRIGAIDGTAVIKNSSGDTWIGEATGGLRVSGAHGTIAIDRALATVVAKTAKGDVRLGEVVRGAISAHTAYGEVEVGIRDGVAAWLDLATSFGTVRSELESTERPAPGQDTVEVRCRIGCGDVIVRRSTERTLAGV